MAGSRTLPAGMATALAETVTEPRLLLYLGFTSPVYWYSGSGTVDYDSATWTGNGFELTQFTNGPSGGQQIAVEIPNNNSTASAIILNQPPGRKVDCKLYYREGSDTVQIFDGYVTDYPELVNRVSIQATNRNTSYEYTPRLTIAPHVFNHITPAGTTVTWGQFTITLESS